MNAIRNTGDTLKLFQQETFAWHHSEKNNLELNSVALPTLTEKTVYIFILYFINCVVQINKIKKGIVKDWKNWWIIR